MHLPENRVLEGLSLKDFKNNLKDQRISLVFSGMFSQQMLSLLGMSLRRVPNSETVARRLFSLIIEMTQNIRHYSAQKVFSEQDGREIGIGIIGVGESSKHHIVSSGNYARPRDVDNIRARCEQVNAIAEDSRALRDLYKEVRSQNWRIDEFGNQKPGANLGFIDMVRKSKNPLDYSIVQPKGEEYAFFVLTVKIDKAL